MSLSLSLSLSGPSFLPVCREAISLVCEAVPGTKGAPRKRKVRGSEGGSGGGEKVGREKEWVREGEKAGEGEVGRHGDVWILVSNALN